MSGRALQALCTRVRAYLQTPPRVAQRLGTTPTPCLSGALLALAILGLQGCASPAATTPTPSHSYITQLANPDGSVGKVLVHGALGEQQIDQAGYASLLDGSQPPAPVDAEAFQRDFGEAMAARPEIPQHLVLYFETGSALLSAEAQSLLPQVLAGVARRASAELLIIGHADAVGSAERNEGLALKRAQAVAEALKHLGLQVDQLTVASQGQRAPRVATPGDTAEARNRRVEITIR